MVLYDFPKGIMGDEFFDVEPEGVFGFEEAAHEYLTNELVGVGDF